MFQKKKCRYVSDYHSCYACSHVVFPLRLKCFSLEYAKPLLSKSLLNDKFLNLTYILENYETSTCGLYRTVFDEIHGLLWAFLHYFNCHFSTHFFRFLQIESGYINGINIFLNDIMKSSNDFDRNFENILDFINFKDNEKNRNILKENGLSDVDIGKERQCVMKHLRTMDIHRKKIDVSKVDSHVTHLRYNTTKQKEMLLGYDKSVCYIIKNMSYLLEQKWDYHRFC